MSLNKFMPDALPWFVSIGMDHRNGCSCEVHRQQPLARSWLRRILWPILISDESSQSWLSSWYRFHLQQSDSWHRFRHSSLVSRPMVTTTNHVSVCLRRRMKPIKPLSLKIPRAGCPTLTISNSLHS